MRDASPEDLPTTSSDVDRPTSPSDGGDITRLLSRVGRGDEGAGEALFQRVYEELRVVAHARLRSENRDATLSTTGLVHEAYLRMAPVGSIDWQDRTHFFATAARAFLASRGQSEKSFMNRIKGSIAWRKLQQEQVTEEKLNRFFEENKDRFGAESLDQGRQQVVGAYVEQLWDEIVARKKPDAKIRMAGREAKPRPQPVVPQPR